MAITINHQINDISATSGSLTIETAGAERMRIDSSGNVGIGTAAPASYNAAGQNLVVSDSAGASGITIASSTTDSGHILFADSTTGTGAYDGLIRYDHTTQSMRFGVNAGVERMRLDSSGNLLINRTATDRASKLRVDLPQSTNGSTLYISRLGGTASKAQIEFANNNGIVGGITTSGSSTSYNTSSDYRLKTDVQPMTGASARVQALKPVNFEWIADGSRVDGFIAHEAQEVVSECATGTKDAMMDEEYEVTPAVLDDEGNVVTEAVMGTRNVPDYQGIDQSKLVPLLTAALQEALAKIEAMEARLAVLEGN